MIDMATRNELNLFRPLGSLESDEKAVGSMITKRGISLENKTQLRQLLAKCSVFYSPVGKGSKFVFSDQLNLVPP